MNYVIGEEFTLPSLGKVYNVEVNPNIKLRSMTTNEEMKRLNHSDRPYKTMAEIIDDCLVTKLPISSYDMCLGDYQFLLHRLRIVTYGPDYALSCTCPLCTSQTVDTINLEDMQVNQLTDDLYESLRKYFEFDLPRSKSHISIRLQTPHMIDDVNLAVKDFKKRASLFQGDSAILFTLKSLIREIDYETPDPLKVESWIQNLPMMDTNYILKAAQRLNESIGISTDVDVTCDVCGLDYKAPFRINGNFFGPEVDF